MFKMNSPKLKTKALFCILTIFVFIAIILFQGTHLNISASDYDESWAKDVIEHFLERGIISPDENGKIEPRKPMTRAEVAIIINKALNFTKTAEINYTDVKSTDFFYKDLQIAKGMGYMIGGGDNQPFRPNEPITRQEMSIIVSRVLELQPNVEAAEIFNDFEEIPTYEAKGAIGAMADPAVKVLEGIGDGLFAPNSDITRDQAYTMVYRAEKIYRELQSGEREYSSVNIFQRETVGNTLMTQNYHNVSIYSQDTSLKNIVVWGDLTIQGSASDSGIRIDDVIVKGNTYIYGGEQIKISNSKLNAVVINNINDSAILEFNEKSSASKILINSGAVINAPAMTVSDIVISGTPENAVVYINALLVENIELQSSSAVNIIGGIVRELVIDEKAENTVVFIEKPVNIVNATISSSAVVYGQGTLIAANLKTSRTVIVPLDTKVTDMFGRVISENENDKTSDVAEQNNNQSYDTGNTGNSYNNNNSDIQYNQWDYYNSNQNNTQNQNPPPNSNNNNSTGQQNNQNNQSNQNNNQGNQNNQDNGEQNHSETNEAHKLPEEIWAKFINESEIILIIEHRDELHVNIYPVVNGAINYDPPFIVIASREYGNHNGVSGYILKIDSSLNVNGQYKLIVFIDDNRREIIIQSN